MAMTAEQLVSIALTRISIKKINFCSSETRVNFIYLGQKAKEHYFMLSISLVELGITQNEIAVKQAVEVLEELGLEDLHWRHDDSEALDKYLYYCTISDSELLKR